MKAMSAPASTAAVFSRGQVNCFGLVVVWGKSHAGRVTLFVASRCFIRIVRTTATRRTRETGVDHDGAIVHPNQPSIPIIAHSYNRAKSFHESLDA